MDENARPVWANLLIFAVIALFVGGVLKLLTAGQDQALIDGLANVALIAGGGTAVAAAIIWLARRRA